MIKSIDANAPDYWPMVRANARKRSGLKLAQVHFKRVRKTLIYEQYLLDCLHIIHFASEEASIATQDYEEFKTACANLFGLPELADTPEGEIIDYAQAAIAEAADELYGA